MTKSREEIAATRDDAQWEWLRAHLERGALIRVSSELDLVDVALKVANDDAAAVQQWLASGEIRRPVPLEIEAWDTNRTLTFSMIIVSPYILFQENQRILQ